MTKRMRKKKHKGEFNHLGFDVHGTFDAPITWQQIDDVVDSFIDFVEGHGMQVGGGCCQTSFGFFVTAVRRIERLKTWHRHWERRLADQHATEAHRRAVLDWFRATPTAKVATVTVGPLKGSWT